MAEQPCQQRQSLVSQNLVYKWFLPFKRFNGAARREIVIFVQFGIRNLWEQLNHRGQAIRSPAIPAVPGLPKYELSPIRSVPQIKPIGAGPEEWGNE